MSKSNVIRVSPKTMDRLRQEARRRSVDIEQLIVEALDREEARAN